MDRDLVAALKLLTDATRLRIVGSLAGSPATPTELAERLSVPLPVVVKQLGLLHYHGLVSASGGDRAYSIRLDTLQQLGRRLDEIEREATGAEGDGTPDLAGRSAEDARILRAFVVDGRLESIPAQDRKRQVILRYLLDECFPEDRAYPEKEVNQRLGLFHPDVAALRRYLVDSRLMTRAAGEYRRGSAPGTESD
jgi:hypothetical protein